MRLFLQFWSEFICYKITSNNSCLIFKNLTIFSLASMSNIFILQSVHSNKITIKPNKILLNDFEIDEPKLINFFHELKVESKNSEDELHNKLFSLLYFVYT